MGLAIPPEAHVPARRDILARLVAKVLSDHSWPIGSQIEVTFLDSNSDAFCLRGVLGRFLVCHKGYVPEMICRDGHCQTLLKPHGLKRLTSLDLGRLMLGRMFDAWCLCYSVYRMISQLLSFSSLCLNVRSWMCMTLGTSKTTVLPIFALLSDKGLLASLPPFSGLCVCPYFVGVILGLLQLLLQVLPMEHSVSTCLNGNLEMS